MAAVIRSNPAPAFREEPDSQGNNKDGPHPVSVKFEDPNCLQQEQCTQSDQDNRCRGHLGGFDFVASPKGLAEAQRIRGRFSHLEGPGGANGINDLVHVKECDSQAENRIQARVVYNRLAPYQQRESHQVRQSLGILAGVNRAHAEGKEAGQNARHGGIRTGARRDWRGCG